MVVASSRYIFVPARQFVGVNVSGVRFPAARNATLLARARTATRFSVSGGIVRTTADPPPSFVQRVTGRRIQRVSIDRVRARPTSIHAGTINAAARGGHIGVVAPTRERAALTARRGAATSEARPARSATSRLRNQQLRNQRANQRRATASTAHATTAARQRTGVRQHAGPSSAAASRTRAETLRKRTGVRTNEHGARTASRPLTSSSSVRAANATAHRAVRTAPGVSTNRAVERSSHVRTTRASENLRRSEPSTARSASPVAHPAPVPRSEAVAKAPHPAPHPQAHTAPQHEVRPATRAVPPPARPAPRPARPQPEKKDRDHA